MELDTERPLTWSGSKVINKGDSWDEKLDIILYHDNKNKVSSSCLNLLLKGFHVYNSLIVQLQFRNNFSCMNFPQKTKKKKLIEIKELRMEAG